jgi:hypothetical protein
MTMAAPGTAPTAAPARPLSLLRSGVDAGSVDKQVADDDRRLHPKDATARSVSVTVALLKAVIRIGDSH